MKNIFFAAFVVCFLSVSAAFAQEVTNDELYKYAIVMETKDLFQSELSAQITDYVEKQDPAIKNRYNALAGGETPANDAEKKFIGQVNSMKSDRSSDFLEAYKTMIQRVLGSDSYGKVKKALSGDDAVKQRYSAIVQAIQGAKETASASSGK